MAPPKPADAGTQRSISSDPGLFSDRVLKWFARHGRHDLPWQQDPTPYRVWVSEIMLQQTQVATVIPYYLRFMERFPDVDALAQADIDTVLHLWTGLGYYARARNLHRAARHIMSACDGKFPDSAEALESLPGIGRSTAGAIAALAMNIRAPILDGNVKRVLTRFHAVEGRPEQSKVKHRLWQLADRYTPHERVARYTQAIMDLGATVCTRSNPLCEECPLQSDCRALAQDAVADFPGRKPRQSLPVKSVRMLVFQNDKDEVLLEKRPPQGIWGGLYSLPEIALADSSNLAGEPEPEGIPYTGQSALAPVDGVVKPCREGTLHAGPPALVATADWIELAPIRHSFSHYHLDITPTLCRTGRQLEGVADSNRWLWYPLDHSMKVGLAAPIRKLLNDLATDD